MKDRFKKYLEAQFRTIRPTAAAMQYREDTLRQLMDRAQELKIKGIEDEDLIFDTCIDELGDFGEALKAFDVKEHKVDDAKRKALLTLIIVAGAVVALTAAYLITSFATGAWAQTWLIMVGGVFAGLLAGYGIAVPKFLKMENKKKGMALIRVLTAIAITLIAVFLFLVLLIVANVNMSWLTFLVLPIAILATDTSIAFATNSKTRWFELPIFTEVLCALLYVILGIVGLAPWNPTWILCLGGVVVALIEIGTLVAVRNKDKKAAETDKLDKKYKKEDEAYWSEWKD